MSYLVQAGGTGRNPDMHSWLLICRVLEGLWRRSSNFWECSAEAARCRKDWQFGQPRPAVKIDGLKTRILTSVWRWGFLTVVWSVEAGRSKRIWVTSRSPRLVSAVPGKEKSSVPVKNERAYTRAQAVGYQQADKSRLPTSCRPRDLTESRSRPPGLWARLPA